MTQKRIGIFVSTDYDGVMVWDGDSGGLVALPGLIRVDPERGIMIHPSVEILTVLITAMVTTPDGQDTAEAGEPYCLADAPVFMSPRPAMEQPGASDEPAHGRHHTFTATDAPDAVLSVTGTQWLYFGPRQMSDIIDDMREELTHDVPEALTRGIDGATFRMLTECDPPFLYRFDSDPDVARRGEMKARERVEREGSRLPPATLKWDGEKMVPIDE